jgi:hypothetical protein
MKRQVRRGIKRSWEKVKPFTICNDAVAVGDLSNTAVDVLFKVSDDLLLRYNLDMFKRWRLYPYVVVDGFFFQGFHYNIGVASDTWITEHFDVHDDSDFEPYVWLGCE